MREIKFRGWNEKNSQWIYGFLVKDNGNVYIVPGIFFPQSEEDLENLKVDPKSVGQYVNIIGKDDREAYEGDILEDRYNGNRYCISYCTSSGSFYLFNKKHQYDSLYATAKTFRRFNVIGNSYKNFELLG